MSDAIDNLVTAQKIAMDKKPKVNGFPYLAEVLNRAGILRNTWYLPSCQSVYFTTKGPVMFQLSPLLMGMSEVPRFNKELLRGALRADQSGDSTFPEFLLAAWNAGVVRYEVDFTERVCTYFGINGDEYIENYPLVEI